jgi:hypothetical protein
VTRAKPVAPAAQIGSRAAAGKVMRPVTMAVMTEQKLRYFAAFGSGRDFGNRHAAIEPGFFPLFFLLKEKTKGRVEVPRHVSIALGLCLFTRIDDHAGVGGAVLLTFDRPDSS